MFAVGAASITNPIGWVILGSIALTKIAANQHNKN
jgi:hypothetical protein